MFVVRDCEHVQAPIERCFQLATHLELVADVLGMKTLKQGGTRFEGLVEGGDHVVWYGWKFGLPHMHESVISRYESPTFFQDTMKRGRFKRFQHDHQFSEVDGHTLMVDYVRFSMPLGFAGRMVGRQIVVPHVAKLLRTRLQLLKRIAEGEEWRQYLGD
jgi:hypothetical protein